MIKLSKLTVFKILLLMILSLKVGTGIYQNVLFAESIENAAMALDIDESEKEESKEIDEKEKIQQDIIPISLDSLKNKSKTVAEVILSYKILHLEFTTPPPEIV